MSTNRGAYPLDPATSVGRLRALLGDTAYVPLDPAEFGFVNYAAFSDVDLAAYAAQANGVEMRAAGYAVQRLALEYAAAGRSIKTDDLAIDVRGRGADLLAVSKSFFAQADAAVDAANADFFEVVPLGPRSNSYLFDVEAVLAPVGPSYSELHVASTPTGTGPLDGGSP